MDYWSLVAVAKPVAVAAPARAPLDGVVRMRLEGTTGTLTSAVSGSSCENDMLEFAAALDVASLGPDGSLEGGDPWITAEGVFRISADHLEENPLRWSATVTAEFIAAFEIPSEVTAASPLDVTLDVWSDPIAGAFGSLAQPDGSSSTSLATFATCESIVSPMLPPVCE